MSSTDHPHLTLEREAGVATVVLDRPDRHNAYSPDMAAALAELLDRLDEKPGIRAAMLTGRGTDAFCAGMDITAYLELGEGDDVGSVDTLLESTHETHRIVKTLRRTELPVVAAVNGHAVGGGMDIALACDFRTVKADARLAQVYRNVGLVPDAGAYLLPRLVGEETAKELIMTGDPILGSDAAEMGLAREVVDGDADTVRAAAHDFAARLADGPTVAIGTAKGMVNESFEVTIETALAHAIDDERRCHGTADHREGIQAFVENREPDFEGR